MSGFSADWLTLREPYDLNARNPTVIDAVAAALEPLSSVQIVDLACGTGSTIRALSPLLPARQNWKLIDNDLGLLARAAATPRAKQVAATTIPLDLNRDLEAALDGADRPGRNLGLARSGLRVLAGPARGRDRRALDPALRRAEL